MEDVHAAIQSLAKLRERARGPKNHSEAA
jgi:hypothetical protein